MKNRVIALLCALFLATTALAFISKINTKPINVALGVDYSIPIANRTQKPYKSKLPDSWYNPSEFYGCSQNSFTNNATAGIDLISTDGQVNYANQEILALEMGTSVEFYLEVGASNYPYTLLSNGINYYYANYSTIFSSTVSLNYNGTTHNLYDSSVSPTFDNQVFIDDLKNANKIAFLTYNNATSSYDYENMTANGDYRLMKFTITANEVGTDVLEIAFGDYQYVYGSVKLLINVYQTNGIGKIATNQIQAYTDFNLYDPTTNYSFSKAEQYYKGSLNGQVLYFPQNATFYLSKYCTPYVDDNSIYQFTDLSGGSYIELIDVTTDSDLLINKNLYGDYNLIPQKAGAYEITCSSTFNLTYQNYNDSSSVYQKNFLNTFTLIFYTDLSLIPQNEILNESKEICYPTDYEINFSLNLPTDVFSVNYFVDNESVTTKFFTEPQKGTFKAETKNLLYFNSAKNAVSEYVNNSASTYRANLEKTGLYDETTVNSMVNDYKIHLEDEMLPYAEEKYFPTLTTQYSYEVVENETLLPTLQLNLDGEKTTSTFSIDLSKYSVNQTETALLSDLTLVNDSPLLTIENYDKISQIAKVELYTNSNDIYFRNGSIYFSDYAVGSNQLLLVADYGKYGSKKSNFTVNLTDSSIDYFVSDTSFQVTQGQSVTIPISCSRQDFDNTETTFEVSSKFGYVTYTQNGQSIILNGVDLGVDYLTLSVMNNGVELKKINFSVIVLAKENLEDLSVDFEQGSHVKIYLTDLTNHVNLTVANHPKAENLNYNFLCLNTAILQVQKTGDKTAVLTAKAQGKTTVLAFCQLADGTSVNAMCEVTIFTEKPSCDITFKNSSDSAFTVYDQITCSINTNGFMLSNNVETNWYIDGVKVDNTALPPNDSQQISPNGQSLITKLTKGEHLIKVEVFDKDYQLNLSCEKQIYISEVFEKSHELSFKESSIDLVYTGDKNDIYVTNIYLDNVLNGNQTYSWSLDDNSICQIMNSGEKFSIEPLKAGETTLHVFTTVGEINKRTIRCQLKINVEEIKEIAFTANNKFPKPGETVKIELIVNGKNTFKNLNLPIEVSFRDQTNQTVIDKTANQITLVNAFSDVYSISTTYGELSANYSITVSSFNLREILEKALPILIFVAIIAIVLLVLFTKKNNPFANVTKRIDKLEKQIDSSILQLKSADTEDKILKELKLVNSQCGKLLASSTYYLNEGHDQLSPLCQQILTLKKITFALCNSKCLNNEKTIAVLNKIKENQFNEIQATMVEIKLSYEKYLEEATNKEKAELLAEKQAKQKKKALTKEELKQENYSYLLNKGFFDDEGE